MPERQPEISPETALVVQLAMYPAGPVSVDPHHWNLPGILQQKLEHPYLVFTNESKKEILERVRTDPFAAEVMALLKHYGERSMLTTVEPELTINDPAARYTETNPYLDYQMFYLNGAYNLAFLYQMTGSKRMPTGRSISSTSFARWIPGCRAHTISKSSIRGCGLTGSPTIRYRSLTIFP